MVGARCLRSSHPWPTSRAHPTVAILLGSGIAGAAPAVVQAARTATISTETQELPLVDHLDRFFKDPQSSHTRETI